MTSSSQKKMAIKHHQQTQSSLLDALYCEEEEENQYWEDDEEENGTILNPNPTTKVPLMDQDLSWEDEELLSLFSKEQHQTHSLSFDQTDPSLLLARKEAVEWILKVNDNYGFSPLTAILSINYLDRFLSSLHFQKDKPWMIQLLAVTCLSLAAKVEETQVPLLLDLQVEDAKYLFEAKNVQKMELLVMSTLQWRMNPVTPISFLDHIIRRLGSRNHVHWEIFKRCESLILSVVSDSRFVRYAPSVLATATMLHVIDEVEPSNSIEYQNKLLGILKTTKERVNECYEVVVELSKASSSNGRKKNNPHKRKHEQLMMNPDSPVGVMDAYFSCDDNSNDSWDLGSSSLSSSEQPLFKKMRVVVQEQQQHQLGFGSLCNVFAGSPAR